MPDMRVASITFLARLAGLGLFAAASATMPAISAERPEQLAIWRTIFARPQTIPAPPDNPLSPAKIELGRRLFHDTRLSGAADRSCATCHRASLGYSNGEPLGPGRNGRSLARNVPGLSNLAWAKRFFWDGRATSLEEQAAGPILAPDEMGGSWPQITDRLQRDPEMVDLFYKAFPEETAGGPITPQRIMQSLAAYERTLVSPTTRFDRYIAGDLEALSPIEQRGFALFVGRAGCVACHGGWRFTDDRLHDIGLPYSNEGADGNPNRAGKSGYFKTPSLRELVHTAPYMHDGSKATLEDVIAHYDGGFTERPELSSNIVRDLKLSAAEREALIAFLKTLSSE